MTQTRLSAKDIEDLRRFDTCTLSNAIERFNVRPRNEGFMQDGPACMFRSLPPVVGFAATAKMRAASQPVNGHCYYDDMDWWRYLASVPPPRVIVVLDADDPPGVGALFGELHAHICRAMDSIAYITNGAVRDLPEIEGLGFQLFAHKLSPSHAYAHIVEFGKPVEIGGLRIQSGDLLHADLHGVQTIPVEIAPQLPAIAIKVLAEEQALIEMCLDGKFSIERLAATIRNFTEAQKC